MARTERGPMSSAHGVIGPLVYYKWKGKECVRTKPTVNKQRKLSQKEKTNRGKFGYAQQLLSRITPFIRLGFHNFNENQTAFNAAMSYTLKNAIFSNDTDFYIDHSQLRISKGIESPLYDIFLNYEKGIITCTWEYDLKTINTSEVGEFRSILLILPEDQHEAVDGIIIGKALVAKGEQIQLLYSKPNQLYHIHLGFVCIEHSNRKIESEYLGSIST